MINIIGLIFSYSLILLILIITIMLQYFFKVNDENARKFIHITISHWWIIAVHFFDHYLYAIIPTITFIILNYLSYRYYLVKPMERQHNDDLGTIYYPIAMLILVFTTFQHDTTQFIGGIGIFILGYGDGFASIIGQHFGKTKLIFNKTLAGSVTMFGVSFIIMLILLSIYNSNHLYLASITIALVATTFELISPKGLDNITVPIMSSLAYYVLFF